MVFKALSEYQFRIEQLDKPPLCIESKITSSLDVVLIKCLCAPRPQGWKTMLENYIYFPSQQLLMYRVRQGLPRAQLVK